MVGRHHKYRRLDSAFVVKLVLRLANTFGLHWHMKRFGYLIRTHGSVSEMQLFLLVAYVGDLYGLVVMPARTLASQETHMDGEELVTMVECH